MAAGNYHQHMVTLVLMVTVSMLMGAIYLTKLNPASMNHTYRRDFSTEFQHNQVSLGHVLRRNGSLVADKTSIRALEDQMQGVEVVRLLRQPSNQKLTSLPEAVGKTSYRANNASRKLINATLNNASTLKEIDSTLNGHSEKLIKTMSEQNKTKEASITCFPKKNIVLLKTHKTGSSTVQNILYRFGDNHDLIFALPKGRDNYFGGNRKFSRRYVRPLQEGHQVNVLANHARWNKEEFVAMMPEDTIYITILRHPATQYESLYIYYNWERFFKVPFHEFVKDPAKFCDMHGSYISGTPRHSFKNPSLFDLGVETGSKALDKDIIEGILDSLGEDFQLVLLMEYMEESVILLKELMCWRWEDVLYFMTNSRSQNQINKVTQEMTEKLIEWNAEDWMLYKYFNNTFWRKVEDYGFEKMQKDKMILRKKNEEMKRKCLQGTKVVSEVRTTIKRFQLSHEGSQDKTCSQMVEKSLKYLYFLNDKMSSLS